MANVALALTLAIIMGATGDVLLSTGMQSMGAVRVRRLSDVPRLLAIVFSNPYVMFGVVSMAVYFASYITALAWVDVSVANPLTALSYLLATGYAWFVMHERISANRLAGLVLIVVGAVFVGVSS
jgi:drug/metabolite transporter (DMT)-like permease